MTVDRRLPARVAGLLSFAVQCQPVMKEAAKGHCEVAELFARRLGFPEHVQHALRFQFERWDGRGIGFGIKGEAIPPAARVIHLAQMVALAYQFGYLILPAVVPAALWIGLNRSFIERLVRRDGEPGVETAV